MSGAGDKQCGSNSDAQSVMQGAPAAANVQKSKGCASTNALVGAAVHTWQPPVTAGHAQVVHHHMAADLYGVDKLCATSRTKGAAGNVLASLL